MILSEPAYEALSPEAKAGWHNATGNEGLAVACDRLGALRGAVAASTVDAALYRAEKHYRVARRILWAAEMKQKPA